MVHCEEQVLRAGLPHNFDAVLPRILEHIDFARGIHVDNVERRIRYRGHACYP